MTREQALAIMVNLLNQVHQTGTYAPTPAQFDDVKMAWNVLMGEQPALGGEVEVPADEVPTPNRANRRKGAPAKRAAKPKLVKV